MSYYFDPAQEELEIEFNSRYDYVSEAYAGMEEDPATLQYEMEECAREWDAEMTAAYGSVVCAPSRDHDDIPF